MEILQEPSYRTGANGFQVNVLRLLLERINIRSDQRTRPEMIGHTQRKCLNLPAPAAAANATTEVRSWYYDLDSRRSCWKEGRARRESNY
jgi:hypothetical protein